MNTSDTDTDIVVMCALVLMLSKLDLLGVHYYNLD